MHGSPAAVAARVARSRGGGRRRSSERRCGAGVGGGAVAGDAWSGLPSWHVVGGSVVDGTVVVVAAVAVVVARDDRRPVDGPPVRSPSSWRTGRRRTPRPPPGPPAISFGFSGAVARLAPANATSAMTSAAPSPASARRAASDAVRCSRRHARPSARCRTGVSTKRYDSSATTHRRRPSPTANCGERQRVAGDPPDALEDRPVVQVQAVAAGADPDEHGVAEQPARRRALGGSRRRSRTAWPARSPGSRRGTATGRRPRPSRRAGTSTARRGRRARPRRRRRAAARAGASARASAPPAARPWRTPRRAAARSPASASTGTGSRSSRCTARRPPVGVGRHLARADRARVVQGGDDAGDGDGDADAAPS